MDVAQRVGSRSASIMAKQGKVTQLKNNWITLKKRAMIYSFKNCCNTTNAAHTALHWFWLIPALVDCVSFVYYFNVAIYSGTLVKRKTRSIKELRIDLFHWIALIVVIYTTFVNFFIPLGNMKYFNSRPFGCHVLCLCLYVCISLFSDVTCHSLLHSLCAIQNESVF